MPAAATSTKELHHEALHRTGAAAQAFAAFWRASRISGADYTPARHDYLRGLTDGCVLFFYRSGGRQGGRPGEALKTPLGATQMPY